MDTMQQTRPVAVIHGSITVPCVTFMSPPGLDPATRRRIEALPGRRRNEKARISHPIHGDIIGGDACPATPDWDLLDQCETVQIGELEQIDGLQLRYPIVTDGPTAAVVRIWPRLAGADLVRPHIPTSAQWEGRCWFVPRADLISADGKLPDGFLPHPDLTIHARQNSTPAPQHTEHNSPLSALATATSIDEAPDAYQQLINEVGDLPDWFGMHLRPYQQIAAPALAAGRRLLGDEPGTGKTVMSLAAAAIMGAQRILIAAPGIALSHWAREVERTRLIDHMGEDAQITTIVAGRKQPDLPDRGVIITTPTLLRDRDQLRADTTTWHPQLLIFDEAHSAKTWTSKVSKAMREVAAACDAAFALTGTPMFKSPEEIVPLLDITGTLDPVFGGFTAFRARFMKQIRFEARGRGGRPRTVKKWVPRPETLPELKQALDAHCWIRRTKNQVQADLPPKVRSARIVDIKPAQLVDAHKKVLAKINEWLDEFHNDHGRTPFPEEITAYAKENIGLSSPLREATGIAKIPAAVEHVQEWVESTGKNPDGTWSRPLIVWVHHHVVADALADALTAEDIPFTQITGGTGPAKIGQIVDEFQAGQWPILLASIHAAGTGITLTRASDELFVETDWTNALVSQAESRAHRHGQDRPVLIETMIAPGTLDVAIQAVLRRNAEFLKGTTADADVDVAVIGDREKLASMTPQIENIQAPSDIVQALVEEALRAWARN